MSIHLYESEEDPGLPNQSPNKNFAGTLSLAEVMGELGTSEDMIIHMIENGDMPGMEIDGEYRINEEVFTNEKENIISALRKITLGEGSSD